MATIFRIARFFSNRDGKTHDGLEKGAKVFVMMQKKKKINGLTTAQVRELQGILLARKDELMNNILARSSGVLKMDAGTNVEYLDRAVTAQHQAVSLRVMDKEVKLLAKIEHSLSKLENGRYGLCEATGEPIGHPRLRAVPWARYCIRCTERCEMDQSLD